MLKELLSKVANKENLTYDDSRQSAAPLFDDAARLPCFAILTPAAAIVMD